MLQPVRTKYRKAFKGRIHGKASRAVQLNYGQFGLKAMQPDRIIGKQIEAGRHCVKHFDILVKALPFIIHKLIQRKRSVTL